MSKSILHEVRRKFWLLEEETNDENVENFLSCCQEILQKKADGGFKEILFDKEAFWNGSKQKIQKDIYVNVMTLDVITKIRRIEVRQYTQKYADDSGADEEQSTFQDKHVFKKEIHETVEKYCSGLYKKEIPDFVQKVKKELKLLSEVFEVSVRYYEADEYHRLKKEVGRLL